MFGEARTLDSEYFRPIEIYLSAGLFYSAIATVVFIVLRMVERKLRIPGLEKVR
jgi:ABC-type amino acid transport system permease subunit